MIILGMDVSTSCTGVCVLDSDIQPDDKGSHILLLDKIEFKKEKTMWEKADRMRDYLHDLGYGDARIKFKGPQRVVLEEALMAFQPGMSSAATISTLLRFNGIVSYIARKELGLTPEYIGSAAARKLCGIKLQQKKTCGKGAKDQVFDFLCANDLKHVVWDKKKSGLPVDTSKDISDAYVIARAASLMQS